MVDMHFSEIDEVARQFGTAHGEFELLYTPTTDPYDFPWTAIAANGDGFGGYTAIDAIEFAQAELSKQD